MKNLIFHTIASLLDCSLQMNLFFSADQIITLCDHPSDFLIRYASIQNNGIPVFLVLMISRNHRCICLPPEIAPPRINFYIYAHLSFVLISPEKCLFVLFIPHQNPVWIVERCVLIDIFKCHAKR